MKPTIPAPIFILEDDFQQSQTLGRVFRDRYKDREIRLLDTESAFRLKASSDDEVPGLLICDVMLPWAFPGDDEPAEIPEDVSQADGYTRAGNRCYDYVRAHASKAWKKVPVLFHTVLTKEEMLFKETVGNDSRVNYVGKDAKLEDLLLEVDHLLFKLEPESDEETRFFTNNSIMSRILTEGLLVKSSAELLGLADVFPTPT